MPLLIADRVMETSATTGVGPYVLAGAVPGYRAVSSVGAPSDTFYYFAEHLDIDGAPSGGWEVGLGTINANLTIDRTAVHASSNMNLAVAWAAGIVRIGIGLSATQITGFSISVINAAARLIQTQSIVAGIVARGNL